MPCLLSSTMINSMTLWLKDSRRKVVVIEAFLILLPLTFALCMMSPHHFWHYLSRGQCQWQFWLLDQYYLYRLHS